MKPAEPHIDGTVPAAGIWAELAADVGSVAGLMRAEYRKREKLWAHLHPVQITGPDISTAASPPVLAADRPDLLGPHTGYHWDVRRLGFAPADPAAMWAGTIWVYKSLPSGSSLIDTWTADRPVRFFGKAYLMLSPHDRIVYAAGPDFDGTAQVTGEALLIADDCVPVYLT